jgi:aspartate 1-decarboxylase
VPDDQVVSYKPMLVFVDGVNRIKEERAHIPVQATHGESATAQHCAAVARRTPVHGH